MSVMSKVETHSVSSLHWLPRSCWRSGVFLKAQKLPTRPRILSRQRAMTTSSCPKSQNIFVKINDLSPTQRRKVHQIWILVSSISEESTESFVIIDEENAGELACPSIPKLLGISLAETCRQQVLGFSKALAGGKLLDLKAFRIIDWNKSHKSWEICKASTWLELSNLLLRCEHWRKEENFELLKWKLKVCNRISSRSSYKAPNWSHESMSRSF